MAKADANLSQCPPAWSTTLFPFFPCLLVVFFALNVVGVPPNPRSLVVFSSLPASGTADEGSTAVARKQLFELQNHPGLNNNKEIIELKIQYLTGDEQRQFLLDRVEECSFRGVAAAHVFEFLQGRNEEIQSEIFKWCALATSSFDVSVWLDSRSPILNMAAFQSTVSSHQNVAVVDSDLIHGSYLKLMASKSNKTLALHMLQTLLKADLKVLQSYALLVPKTLKKFIAETETDWQYLNLSCRKGASPQVPMGQSNTVCPTTGYCCSIQDARTTILLSRHYMLPALSIPDKLPMKPFNARDDDDDNDDMDDHFISTIQVKDLDPVDDGETPNFYDLLSRNHCLPDQDDCTKCLREKKGATCDSCGTHCVCYCQKLCHTVVPAKRVVQEWTISPPLYTKDPSRLVPRVIHQTWFEELNEESYPNMSRLVESFKRSGWEYRFYTDDDAIAFLRRHFPRPVLEAYQTLVPGAFKADLFRYCVLLIVGGVYADVDVHLESALDVSIPPDVGFMVPVDEPGKPVQKQMCLWNGFIASAPNHPFLAKAIETVVNQVRNRFTSVDIDATFCPNPELSVLHAYDTLFTAGPCLLGSSLNRVLGRNPQTSHVPGELHNLWSGKQRELTILGTSFVNAGSDEKNTEHRIPGRTIILQQNKWDMGAHRFTFLEQNLVVVATDLPDSNDREKVNEENDDDNKHEHYSKAHAKTGIYGVKHLYTDDESVNEEIRIVVEGSFYANK